MRIQVATCQFPSGRDIRRNARYLLAQMGAAKALESWAATETNNLDSERMGDYQYTRGAVSKKLTLAKEYAKQDSELPYLTWAEMDLTGGSAITAEED